MLCITRFLKSFQFFFDRCGHLCVCVFVCVCGEFIISVLCAAFKIASYQFFCQRSITIYHIADAFNEKMAWTSRCLKSSVCRKWKMVERFWMLQIHQRKIKSNFLHNYISMHMYMHTCIDNINFSWYACLTVWPEGFYEYLCCKVHASSYVATNM